jgi:hypothetical protein
MIESFMLQSLFVRFRKFNFHNEKERRMMEELGVRMTRLWERGRLETAAVAFLKSLARIDRPYLTELEAMWLEDLEGENEG